jgi:membrane-associated phospholipid phosphatase
MRGWLNAWSRAWILLVFLLPAAASAQDEAPAPATPTPVETDSPCSRLGISTVPRCIGHDLRGVVSGDSLRWLIGGGVLAAGSLLLDDEVLQSFADPDQDQTIAVGEQLGEAGWHFGVPLAFYLVARGVGHDTAAEVAVAVLRTQVVNGIFTRGLKMLPRERPYQEDVTPTKGSFPSGHTSAVFATATVLARRWGWRAGVPAYTVAAFVGASRLQNVHYLSDVAFGAALGVAAGLVVKLPGPHSAVAPMIAPGVVGVSVTFGGDRSAGSQER